MMARGNRALQAALGAIAGGFTGYAEDRKDREERKRIDRAEARQAELDRATAEREELSLLSQLGYKVAPAVKAVDDVTTRTAPASRLPEPSAAFGQPALTAAFSKAVQQDMGGKPSKSALTTPVKLPPLVSTLPSQGEEAPASQKASQTRTPRPTRTVTFRGQQIEMVGPESDEDKADREIATYRRKLGVEQEYQFLRLQEEQKIKKQEYNETLQNLINAGVPKDMATKALNLGGKYNDLFMTPEQQADLALRRAQLKLDQEKLAFEQTKPAAGAKGAAGGTADVPLPSIVDSVNYFSELTPDAIRKISPPGVMLANTGTQQGSWSELGLVGGGSALGMIGDQEKRYAQKAGSIADAVARASEVGVLTNFDINRFRSQIMLSPGDSEKLKQEKVARARSWGVWLANNKKAIDEGKLDRISKTPESVSGYQLSNPGSNPSAIPGMTYRQGMSFEEWKKAQGR